MDKLPPEYRAKDKNAKVLSISWDSEKDFKIHPPGDFSEKLSKRIVLKSTTKRYDPIGILSLVFVGSKLFAREIWMKKI